MAHSTSGAVNGTPDISKMQAATLIIQGNPEVSVPDLRQAMNQQYRLKITPQMASTYRYTIKKKLGLSVRRRGRKKNSTAPVATTPAATKPILNGLEELLAAGRKMG